MASCQVHTEIANEYQLTRDLQPESRRIIYDAGYEGAEVIYLGMKLVLGNGLVKGLAG